MSAEQQQHIDHDAWQRSVSSRQQRSGGGTWQSTRHTTLWSWCSCSELLAVKACCLPQPAASNHSSLLYACSPPHVQHPGCVALSLTARKMEAHCNSTLLDCNSHQGHQLPDRPPWISERRVTEGASCGSVPSLFEAGGGQSWAHGGDTSDIGLSQRAWGYNDQIKHACITAALRTCVQAPGRICSSAALPLHGCAACRKAKNTGAAECASPDQADWCCYLCWCCRNSIGNGESSCVCF